MPGRFAITSPPETLRAFFGYSEQPDFPHPVIFEHREAAKWNPTIRYGIHRPALTAHGAFRIDDLTFDQLHPVPGTQYSELIQSLEIILIEPMTWQPAFHHNTHLITLMSIVYKKTVNHVGRCGPRWPYQ